MLDAIVGGRSGRPAARAALLGASVLALAACSDPEVKAEKAIVAAAERWTLAAEELEPKARLQAYRKASRQLRKAGEKHDETQPGRRLLSGGTVAGVSLTAAEAETARLEGRADCYADPDASCLSALVTEEGKDFFGVETDASGLSAQEAALALVCSDGFAPANAALEPMKVNRQGFTQALLQVGLEAHQCERPEAVDAAVQAALASGPASGEPAAGLSILVLNTPDLAAGHAEAAKRLEDLVAGETLPQGVLAGALLKLAIVDAQAGRLDSASARYRLVTEQMGYRADSQSLAALGEAFAVLGETKRAAGFTGGSEWSSLSKGAEALLVEVGLKGNFGSGTITPLHGETLLAGPDLPRAAAPPRLDRLAEAAEAVAATVDATGRPYVGQSFARLAVAFQRTGQQARADEALARAEAMNAPDSVLGLARAWVSFDRGLTDEALRQAQATPKNFQFSDWAKAGIIARAAEASPEVLLDYANLVPEGRLHGAVITALMKAGRITEAETVLGALGTNQAAYATTLAAKAYESGDIAEGDRIVDAYGVGRSDANRFHLTTAKIMGLAGKRGQGGELDALLAELHLIGKRLDEASDSWARDADEATRAVGVAFKAGRTDTALRMAADTPGIDRHAYFAAMDVDAIEAKDMPRVLLSAHDRLDAEELEAVLAVYARTLAEGVAAES